MIKLNNIGGFDLALIVWVAILLIGMFLLISDDNATCDGSDYGACLVQRMDACLATKQFTREECVTLVAGGKR